MLFYEIEAIGVFMIPDADRIIYLSVRLFAQFLWRYPQVKE